MALTVAKPNVCVLRAPGTNCDVETAYAFQRSGAEAECVHLFRILEQPDRLRQYQILCIPGGFSYGDDIGAGVIFSRQLRFRLGEAIGEFLQADKLALGICNGFQVLLKAGILPGDIRTRASAKPTGGNRWDSQSASVPPPATLTWNDNGKYTAVWVRLRVVSRQNVFLRDIEHIELPIAHAEGKLVVRSLSVLQAWEQSGQVALCYEAEEECGELRAEVKRVQGAAAFIPAGPSLDSGSSTLNRFGSPLPYPLNPNGSVGDIAGLSDPTGRVLGLMPHPERFVFATQHPQWTRRRLTGDGDGLKVFRNAVAYFNG